MSSLFLAHTSGCTFSDRFVILGQGDLKLHPSPQGCWDLALVLGSPVLRCPEELEKAAQFSPLTEELPTFGGQHWEGSFQDGYLKGGPPPRLSQICLCGHLFSLVAGPLGDWRQLA